MHGDGGAAMSAVADVRPALMGHLKDLRLPAVRERSEEHTSELQSPMYLVCRLLLEKKNPDPRLLVPARGLAHARCRRRCRDPARPGDPSTEPWAALLRAFLCRRVSV